MKKRILNSLKYILFLALGLFIFWWIYHGKWSEIGHALKNINYFWIGASVIFSIMSQVSRAVRWNMLIRSMGYKPRFTNTFLSVMILYFVNLLIPRGGEIARCTVLTRTDRIPFTKLLGTVFVERLTDMVALGFLAILIIASQISFLMNFYHSNAEIEQGFSNLFTFKNFIWLVLILGILTVVYIAVRKIFKKSSTRGKFRARIRKLKYNFTEGIHSIAKLENKWYFIGHTAFIFLMWLMMLYVIFLAFEPTKHLSITTGMMVFMIGGLAMIIPVNGGIGTWHGAVIYTLMIYGIAEADGQIFAIIAHATTNLIYIVLGLLALILLPIINSRKFKRTK
ncbi:MAG: flippase-like domain-containing protein [Bacteroidales bacterium]|nr:flippase-like domain-containing protein [Bacteroidales bacterium]